MNTRIIMGTWVAVLVLCGNSFAQAPTSADLNALRSQIEELKAGYEKRIQALESQLQALQGQTVAPPQPESSAPRATQEQQPSAAVPAGAQGAGGPAGALPVYGGESGSKVFNPDIAVIGD